MENASSTGQSKTIVDAYYQAGKESRLTDFAPYLHPDFTTTAPNYLPWGGTHVGAAFFRDQVLPHLPDTLDFSRFQYETFFGDGGQVVALISIGITNTDDVVKISEHWTVEGDKARSIWVAYFEPQALLNKLGITHGLSTL